MKRTKSIRGNISVIFLSLGVWYIILILFITAMLYTQINIVIYNIKSDLFYIVQNSLNRQIQETLAYSDYVFNKEEIKEHVETILKMNYIDGSNSKKGKTSNIKEIEAKEISLLYPGEVVNGCNTLGDKIRIHIKIKIVYVPIVTLLGGEKEIYLHDDIKMELLKII